VTRRWQRSSRRNFRNEFGSTEETPRRSRRQRFGVSNPRCSQPTEQTQ
ncbi:unnamed protein product, partial [Ectocarpus sp. 4 AP-2014]